MKRPLCAICVLLTLALLCPMASAFAAEPADDGIYVEATARDGSEILLADAPDADRIGEMESYDLMIEDEPVLTVEQSQNRSIVSGAYGSGYFSADFLLPDTAKRVFLTGLTAEKVEEIQARIIESYASGADFGIEDLSFIDAEKMRPSGDGDDKLCWAAASSNVLTYTGWAAQAGFASADDVFEAFISAFTDAGGNPFYGIGWFFNGVNTFSLVEDSVASAASGTGGYLTDYAYERLIDEVDIDAEGVRGMQRLHRQLEDGYGIVLSLDIYFQGIAAGGHSLTCWGYIADTTYGEDDPAYYAGLFLTDSDSDEPASGDRRDAKNILQAVSLTNSAGSGGKPTFALDLDSRNHAVISRYYALVPYSAAVEKESAPDATRDKVNTPDLYISGFALDTDFSSGSKTMAEKIESNTAFYYTPIIFNCSDTLYSSVTGISVVIADASGNTVFSRELHPELGIPYETSISYRTSLIHSAGLPDGDYTVTAVVNGDHAAKEAYYYNNTRTYSLKVRDNFLLGDADGNGEVNILDATKIQRILAGFSENPDDRTIRRAAVSGRKLSIVDATQIQRYIASFTVSRPIGEKQLYD